MLEPIPAIDIINGQCVRLTKGKYDTKTIYDASPLEAAALFESLGFRRLHVVDLDGARGNHVANWKVLEELSAKTNLTIDFGGGIKTEEDLKRVFDCGARYATLGSIAVMEPQTFARWLGKYGPERIILGADVRGDVVSISGWKENSVLNLFDFLDKNIRQGVRHVLCTDISRDGTLNGPAIHLYKKITERHPHCHLIASGGVSSMHDLVELDKVGVPYVVFGKAIYENKIDLAEVVERFIP